GLEISGQSTDGPFQLRCPEFYVETHSERQETAGWAIASPVNQPMTISYGAPRQITRVRALINNFDFEYGNCPDPDHDAQEQETLRVVASGRIVDFQWRAGRLDLRRLLDTGILRSTSLTTLTFAAWEGASEEDLAQFAYDIASLCSIVVQQHT